MAHIQNKKKKLNEVLVMDIKKKKLMKNLNQQQGNIHSQGNLFLRPSYSGEYLNLKQYSHQYILTIIEYFLINVIKDTSEEEIQQLLIDYLDKNLFQN